MEYWNKTIVLENLIKDGIITLDRGRVISSIDLMKYPGDYPVYSSSAQKNGYFGSFDLYDFDEELITWSVDGGGYFFYRPKHKFSVTNVSGIMRITKLDKYDYKFLYYLLAYQHKNQIFDYVDKAHPSVIKKRYFIPEIDKNEQIQIATILSKVDEAIAQTEQLIAKYTRIKTGLMQDLLTKGIDENGNIRSEETHEFKDSPLGRIPKEWECDWLGNIAKIQTGGKDTQDKDDTGQYPFYVRSQIVERINSYSFDGEGILTAGDGVGVGKVFHYVNGKFDFHQRVYLIHEFRKDIIGKFIFLYFKENFIKQVDKYSAKNTVDSVRLHMIFEMDVPVLKFSEQKRIVEILDKNDSLVEYLEQELSKLKSLKTGLMQDLLSGKVRVNHLIKETANL